MTGSKSLLVLLLISAAAYGAPTYRFTGDVTAIGKTTISVRRGTEEVEFARPKNLGDVHKGERITIVYSMDAKQITPAREAPGEAAPDQHMILDDRAFYNAKNQAHPDGKNPG